MTQKLFALIDCNNFFVSCERVFNPKLRGVPVMVLSNNDGCVVARSQEVKDLGIPMGAPAFKCEALIKKHNIRVFSSNFELYGDMSARVMSVIEEQVPALEIYSIDEAFIRFDVMDVDAVEFGTFLRKRVLQWTGIPISIGIAPTKTLAKVANQIAKKQKQYNGVYDISRAENIDDILDRFKVEDVWGVGRQYTKKLNRHRITNARQLKYAHDAWVKKNMTITGLRTVHELRGIPCVSLVTQPQDKQSIAHTRSFGKRVTELAELKEAIADYAVHLARKLREERMRACALYVFIMTNYTTEFRYYNGKTIVFQKPTSYTPDIITAACTAVEDMFDSDYVYKKAGIVAVELLPEDQDQIDLLIPEEHKEKQHALMQEIDALNEKWGTGTVGFAAQGVRQQWRAKRAKKTQRFTTKWDELLKIKL